MNSPSSEPSNRHGSTASWTTRSGRGAPLAIGEWVSYSPIRGDKMSADFRTEVRIAYDDRNIYFAFHCFDNEPDKIRTTISRRDNAFNDDWIAHEPRLGRHRPDRVSPVRQPERQSRWMRSTRRRPASSSMPTSSGTAPARSPATATSSRCGCRCRRCDSPAATEVRMGLVFFRKISRIGMSYCLARDAARPVGVRPPGAPAVRQPEAAAADRAAAERHLRRQPGARHRRRLGADADTTPTSA